MAAIVPYSGARWQRGHGIGAVFRSLFRTMAPMVKTAGKRLLKSGLKTGVGLASDALRGRDMKQAVQHRLTGALSEVTGVPVRTGTNRKRRGQIKGGPAPKRVRQVSNHGKARTRKKARGTTTTTGGDIFSR